MAEYIAASLDPDDIQAAEVLSSEGDVIVLPAGDSSHADWNTDNTTWSAAVLIRKGRNLRGQGQAASIMRQTSGSVRFFYFNPSQGTTTYTLEVSGFACIGPSGVIDAPTWPTSGGTGYAIQAKKYPQINFHHVDIHNKNYGIALADVDKGVIWKCNFRWIINNCGATQALRSIAHGTGGAGVYISRPNTSWPSSYPSFGTENAIFVEDCTFYAVKHAITNAGCGMAVVRKSRAERMWCAHGALDCHGNRGGVESGLMTEYYWNDVWLNCQTIWPDIGTTNYGIYHRGGAAAIWGNTFHSTAGTVPNYSIRISGLDLVDYPKSYPADYYAYWAPRNVWCWNNTYDDVVQGGYSDNASWVILNRLSGHLPYDAQTANFTLNDKLTGGTSGAYGYITQDTDAGTTGTLTLRAVVGTFQNNETITDQHTGSALVDSATGLQDAYYDFRNEQLAGYALYTYPHPLRGGNPPAPPPGPVIPPITKFLTADICKIIVCDWELARKLEGETWTSAGSGAYYLSFTDGEVTRIAVNGTAYTEKFSVADVQATASSFYYSLSNSRLYVKTADADSPATYTSGTGYKYCFMAYWWKGISNVGVALSREAEILVDGKVDLWSDSATLKNWSKTTTGTGSLAQEATSVYDVNSAYSAKLTAGDGSAAIYQDIVTRPSGWQRVRLKYAASLATVNFKLRIRNSGSNVWLDENGEWQTGITDIYLPFSTDWVEYEIKFQAHASYSTYRITLHADADDTGFICYVDNIEWKRIYQPKFYDPFLRADSLPNLNMSVGTWHEPEEQVSFGTVGFVNDGFWWQKKDTYIWSNKEMEFRIGETDDIYDDYVPIFFGQSRRPEWTMAGFQVDTKDVRSTLINNCAAIARFDSTTYPNCEDAWKNRGVPILLGNVENITPPCCNTTTFVYKVTQTSFAGATYAQYSLDAVYKNGVLQTLTTHYTVDLTNGTFTMVSDPGTDVITCDAKGIKVDFEETGYAFSIAHYLYFFLKRVNGISETKINLKSFLDLYDKRNIEGREYITDDVDFRELLNKWKRSNSFQIFQSCEGEWFARALASAVPSNAQQFRNVDFLSFNYWEDTDQIYKYIEVRKDQDPTTGDWEVCINDTVLNPNLYRAKWEHDEERTLQLETSVKADYYGRVLACAYGQILNYPLSMIRAVLPARGLLLNPTDKIVVTYEVEMSDGTEVVVFNEQAFIVIAITKDFQNAQAEIIAVKNVADLSWEV